MAFEDMMDVQSRTQAMVGDVYLPEEERLRDIESLVLLGQGEQSDMLRALGYQRHHAFASPRWDNAKHEWVDAFKYLLAVAVVAGWEASDLERIFAEKSEAVEERLMRDRADDRSVPVAVFDLDGVIAEYTELTDAAIASGAFQGATPRQEVINLLWTVRSWGLRIIIVTSRKVWRWRALQLETEGWLRHHRVPFDKLIFAYDKATAVSEYNVVFAVEDSVKHTIDYAEAGINTFFMGDWPYREVRAHVAVVSDPAQLALGLSDLMRRHDMEVAR